MLKAPTGLKLASTMSVQFHTQQINLKGVARDDLPFRNRSMYIGVAILMP